MPFINRWLVRRDRSGTRLRNLFLTGLFFASVFLTVSFLYWHSTGAMSPQSRLNLNAADKPTLREAVGEYAKQFPPAYPTSLWLFSRLGLPVRLFNLLCFLATLSLLWVFSSLYLPSVHPAVPVVLLAINHASYPNLHQQVSESLLVLLAVTSLLLLAYYHKRPTVALAGSLGVLTAFASLTRYFGLFWLFPLIFALLSILKPPSGSWWRRVIHLLAYAVPLLLLVLPWLLHVKRLTGYLSGMDRLAPREFAPANADWGDLTGFATNVKFALKTTFIDLFSPSRTASHGVVNSSGITQSDALVLLAVLALTLLSLVALFQVLRKRARSSRFSLATFRLTLPQFLPSYFAGAYVVAIIGLWTVSNNDPIYTRFMFPSYPFVIMTVLALFAWMKERGGTTWQLLPHYLLGALFVATNLVYVVTGLTESGAPTAPVVQIGSDVEPEQERRHSFELPPVSHPLYFQLGQQVELLGYDLVDEQAAPGGQIELTLYWRARGATDLAYKVFSHLGQPGHAPLAQDDSEPGDGCCPTDTWVEGEIVVDRHIIALPADLTPDTYALMVGMYNEDNGQRLPVFDAEGDELPDQQVQITEVVIQP